MFPPLIRDFQTLKMQPADPGPEVRPELLDTQQFRRQMGQISWHSSVFFLGTIFTAAAGYLFKVYLARTLGAEALGVYALGMTIVAFLGVFNALGLPQAAVRFVAAYCATGKMELLRGFLGRGFLLLLASNVLLGGTVVLVGPWIAVHFYHTPALSPYLGLFALFMLIGVLNAFLGQVLAGYKDVARRTVITSFIANPTTMVFAVGLVIAGFGLWGYIFAQAASAAVVLVLLIAMVWKLTPAPARAFSAGLPGIEKEVISFSVVAFGVGFLEFVISQADRVLIGFYLNAREVGIYAVAGALVTFVPIMLQSVNQIFSPTIADLHARGQRELLGRLYQTLTKWILGLTIPLGAVMIIFATPLMSIFGQDFVAGWPVLALGTLGQLVNCGVGSVGYLLMLSGNQRRLMRIQAVMAAVMVVVSMLLIPRWGIVGAAVGATVTTAITNLWNLREVEHILGLFPYNRSYSRLLLPVAASVAVLLLLRSKFGTVGPQWLVIGVSLVLGYAVFLSTALAFGLNADDRVIADAVWLRVRGVFLRGGANS